MPTIKQITRDFIALTAKLRDDKKMTPPLEFMAKRVLTALHQADASRRPNERKFAMKMLERFATMQAEQMESLQCPSSTSSTAASGTIGSRRSTL